MTDLLEALQARASAQFLMKLALTDINLGSDRVVEMVVDLVHDRKHIQFFDVRNTRLRPKHIYEVTLELADKYMQLRDINLSYNQLDFRVPGSDDREYSEKTIFNLKALLDRAKILNHVNFSGMNITRSQMLSLCNCMNKCALLMGIHLNDNGINLNDSYFLEVLKVFDLGVTDLPRARLELVDPE